jgi:hypothetical protein
MENQNFEILKLDDNETFVGYSLFNTVTKTFFTVGEYNDLIVLDKIKKLIEYKGIKKNQIIIEVSFEGIVTVMNKYGGGYAFNKITLNRFLDIFENKLVTTEDTKKLREWDPEHENSIICICLKTFKISNYDLRN